MNPAMNGHVASGRPRANVRRGASSGPATTRAANPRVANPRVAKSVRVLLAEKKPAAGRAAPLRASAVISARRKASAGSPRASSTHRNFSAI